MKILILTVFATLTAQAKDYNIADFGAVSDTTRLSTQAIQQAIDACSQAGGGRVVVPPQAATRRERLC